MSNLSAPGQDSTAAQYEMFRRAEQECSLSIAVLAKRNQRLKISTMKAWKRGAAMPVCALGELKVAGVPDHLLSLVLQPYAVAIVSEPDDGEGDLDTAASDALEFAGEVQKARSPKSLGGVAIVPQEKALIEPKRQRASASMRRAAA
jgi:hypothetical protein